MKTHSIRYITIALALGAVLAVSLVGSARSNSGATPDGAFTGYISDAMCGVKHMSGMGDDKNCTLACKTALVLADRDHKTVYQLDQAGQEKAKQFAGQKVKITGTLKGKTITVTSIAAETD